MKILVLGGMHGNETLGINLVRSLQKSPIEGVDCLIANSRAVKKGVRFTETDLNRSFGNQPDTSYEIERAKELFEITKEYDIVLDFHNTQTPNNNCAFVGVDANKLLYETASTLGYKRVIQATYDCINKYCLNVISMEISVGDAWDDITLWRRKVIELRDSTSKNQQKVVVYRYLRRVIWDETQRLSGWADWKPFVEIPDADRAVLDVDANTVPIFIGSRFTEYYATLLVKM